MNTNDLISMLATETPAVDHGARRRKIAILLLAGALISFVAMVASMGLNPALRDAILNPWFWVRFAFIVSSSALAWRFFFRLGKPGMAANTRWLWVLLPIAVLAVIGGVMLLQAPEDKRLDMVFGATWTVCSRNIALLSAPIFFVLVLIARGFAPTRLRLTGAILGFFSGAVAALVYSMHCPAVAPSFLMIWYSLGMAIPAMVGMLLGKELLAW